MTHDLHLYELPESPNSQKVRIALQYKGLPYERHVLDLADGYPGDRSETMRVSGQPRLPVLRHGDRAIFDSGAILRYLDANFRETPPVFSDDFDEIREIEEWEWFARTRLVEPTGILFRAASDPENHPDAPARACAMLHDLTARFESRLADEDYLVGNRLTAADIVAVPTVFLGMLPETSATNPISAYFQRHLRLGDDREKTRSWVRRVLEHDPLLRG